MSKQEHIYIDINTNNVNNYVFEGFGTSLSWFANAIGTSGDDEIKNYLCNLLFDQNNKNGLQLSIVRYNIGGLLNNSKKVQLRKGADIPGYDMNYKENWESTDIGQRYFLKKAKELGVNIFEAFSNTPPDNMTISGGVEGNKYRCMNNIKSAKIDNFTDYLISVISYLKQHDDIPFSTISPMNEPSGPGWIVGSGQEGCFYDLFGIRKKVLKSLYKKKHTFQVSACEENNMLQAFFGVLLNPYMWKYVDQYNIHRYTIGDTLKFNTFNIEDSNILRKMIHFIMNTCLKKKIWMSEWGMGKLNTGNSFDMVYKFANSLMDDFIYLRPSAWIYWQVIENLSNNGWGCIQIPFDDIKKENIVYNIQFSTFQHFTHYIKPGSRFLKLQNTKYKNIKIIGCLKNNKVSLIILSKNSQTIDVIFKKFLYNVSIMCSYEFNEAVIVEKYNINTTKKIFLKPKSLTSLSFDLNV